jgi:hypothetical protein
MATTTTCARCKCETHFTRISTIDYEYICVPCKKKEEHIDGKIMKKKYIVGIREVHISQREVEASSPEEAVNIAKRDFDTEVMFEYSHTLEENTWTVEEIKCT